MVYRRPWRLSGATRRCAGRLRPRLAQANGSTAPRSSGDRTSAKIGLGGVLGKPSHGEVCATAEFYSGEAHPPATSGL